MELWIVGIAFGLLYLKLSLLGITGTKPFIDIVHVYYKYILCLTFNYNYFVEIYGFRNIILIQNNLCRKYLRFVPKRGDRILI
ncbi:hypothetical protein SBF1_1330021 [Candidatus Desulfosporosinus infrequens]|uniref:Uncharacterized protein n=1 Tax=Candidatus Desulfosporosinus infrequens TaxID=2043169 RepID=A0A2U3K4C6_9FIRM|nr:hypothetical protein SBF1_1330021 [Candidatus Desulfosporosinus infrequens]